MPLRESLEAIIEALIGRRLDYHALYPCTVASQASDGTLDLLPDDARIRGTGTSGIKIRHGLPGTTVEVGAGTRVLMGFEAGDPSRPYAALWEAGDVDGIDIADAVAEVLRNGEIVNITGVQPGPGVTAATITVNPLTFPGYGSSKLKA